MLEGILKNPLPPEWKEADEIVHHVWLGTVTENKHARLRNITEVICISKEPQADLQREGFRKAPDLDSITFKIESDTEGDLLSIFGEVCDVIDRILSEGEGVLLMDVGGGVATLAAYIMKKHEMCLPEAMTVITRARLKRVKPRILPSKRIIEMLNNDIWQEQLELWQACEYNIYENTVVNPDDPRERWIVERIGESPQEKRRHESPELHGLDKRFPHISDHPHRLSTIEEVEEEAHRFSMIEEVEEEMPRLSEIEEFDEETRRLRTVEEVEEEARRPSSTYEP